jgi:hypothetical protein
VQALDEVDPLAEAAVVTTIPFAEDQPQDLACRLFVVHEKDADAVTRAVTIRI